MAKRMLFIGAGAIGSYLGSFLARAGHDVVLVDPWPEQVEMIRSRGIAVTGPHDPFEAKPTALHVHELQRLGADFDIAFIAMKAYDTAWATWMALPHLKPEGYVVSAQNCWNDPIVAGIVETIVTVGADVYPLPTLDTLMLLSEIFYKIRKRGLVAIEADVDRPGDSAIFTKYPNILKDHEAITFITDTLRTVISTQIDPLELEALMDIEMEEFLKEQMIPSKSLAHIADSLPGLGIVAAVLGVVLTMGKISESPGSNFAARCSG